VEAQPGKKHYARPDEGQFRGNEPLRFRLWRRPGIHCCQRHRSTRSRGNHPYVWRVVRKKNGRIQISAIWTLSPDGNSLRDDFTGYPPNGSSFTIHYIYTPIGGASGFAATWDSISEKPGRGEIEVQPYQDSGLSFINQTQHSTKNMKFDGEDYPVKDANAPAGAMSSARRLNASTLEFTEKRNGKVADTQHIQLSPDGKTLTMTIQPASGRKPNVLVFERE
jgi:hypothetical protein